MAKAEFVVKAVSAPKRVGSNNQKVLNVTEGAASSILCEVELQGADARVVWRKNGAPLSATDAQIRTVGTRSELVIADTKLKDEALYECDVG